jgi:GDP/UDP-N,N'-diacetylbacillosamine 2-epimerase (hydrolysing)
MSRLHFVSTEEYGRRVIQLGEKPDTVFNVGAIGVENMLRIPLMENDAIRAELGVPKDLSYVVATMHPTTLDPLSVKEQFAGMAAALDSEKDLFVVFTLANADAGGREINNLIAEYCRNRHGRAAAFASLGQTRYFSALKYAEFVIGNSSSGVIEAPSLKIPTINIGSRQRGRIRAASVIDCGYEAEEIEKAIRLARTERFRAKTRSAVNPYAKENTLDQIFGIVSRRGFSLSGVKEFYDLQGRSENV